MLENQSTQENITFEDLKLMFLETAKRFQETDRKMQETDRQMQETDRRMQETDRIIKESRADFEKKEKYYQKRYAKLESLFTGQWGKLVESLVDGKLVELLQKRGIDVRERYTRIVSEAKDMEIDIIAANGKDVVVVEVKTTLKLEYVNDFIDKLKRFREIFHRFSEENIFGAVAYIRDESSAAKYAEKQGLLVIRATGDSAFITNNEDFKPKQW